MNQNIKYKGFSLEKGFPVGYFDRLRDESVKNLANGQWLEIADRMWAEDVEADANLQALLVSSFDAALIERWVLLRAEIEHIDIVLARDGHVYQAPGSSYSQQAAEWSMRKSLVAQLNATNKLLAERLKKAKPTPIDGKQEEAKKFFGVN